MRVLKKIFITFIILALLPAAAFAQDQDVWAEAEKIVSRMTLRQKICQMIIVSPEAFSSLERVTMFDETMAGVFRQYPFGGVMIYGKNIENAGQLKAFTAALAGLPAVPFILAEEEGGDVARVALKLGLDGADFPENIAARNNPALFYEAGAGIGAYLNELGFNMDLSPVTDLASGSDVDELRGRTPSSRPDAAAMASMQYAAGLTAKSIIPVYKHFPGLGDENVSSHEVIPRITKPDDEIYSEDILPFRAGIENGAQCIMMSHAVYTQLDPKNPACYSYHIINDILRRELGFEGVVMTDTLDVPAISNAYSEEDAVLLAVGSGCDMI
ncbi:MAG: hypothetical protein CW338_11945, partial [Clostridiales bacterium]|nr:hypothetical protein [Clostridiales bacterium]